jgi:hypothetical protein
MKESPWDTERTGVEWALSRNDSRPVRAGGRARRVREEREGERETETLSGEIKTYQYRWLQTPAIHTLCIHYRSLA